MSIPLDRGDLQGNVLCAYDFAQGAHLLFAIEACGAAAARAWLGELAAHVTSAEPWGPDKPDRTLNVALSHAGLEALGMDPATLASFPAPFREGMAARADRLRDHGEDAPGEWEPGLDDRTAHIVVTVHVNGEDERLLSEAIARVTPPAGVTSVGLPQKTAKLALGREHFGFSDGLAQPAIEGEAGPWHGQGTPGATGSDVSKWAPLALGEFVLGYPDEDQATVPGPPPFGRNASYMVIRKLRQHVHVWEQQLLRWAGGDAERAEYLAGKVVGRWKNGTPLSRSPDAADPALDEPLPLTGNPAKDEPLRRRRFELLNSFRFGDDPEGARCPVGSHVRRANPRDGMGHPDLARRHRMIRRGMPYGRPPVDRLADDGADRGLFFVCFQADIARQFELVQADWLRDGDVFGLGSDGDAFMSPGDTSKTFIPGDDPFFCAPHARTVTLRGGGYFIVPAKSALRALSQGLSHGAQYEAGALALTVQPE